MTGNSVYESAPLAVELQSRADGVVVIAVAGEVDLSNRAELRRALTELITGNAADRVALDLGDLTFLGSAGVAVLLHVRELVRRRHGRLEITHAHEHVRQVLAVSGLTDLFRRPVPQPPTEPESADRV